MSAFFAGAKSRLPQGQDLWALVAIWALLISLPFWLPLLGGYTALASKVLVFGLAAMGLNMLLGFTGVLSFGHAAYFGLGAYGAGLTLRYLVHSTPLAMLAGTLFGGLLIGVAAALTTVFYPAASEAVIYAIMMIVLLVRPRGLMGEEGMMS